MPADQDDGRPRDRRGRPARRSARASRTSAPAASSPATAGGHGAGGEQHDHRGEHRERALGAGAERDGLPAHELRRVDDEHVGVVEVARRARPRCPAAAACRPRPARSRRPRSSPWRCTARTRGRRCRRDHAREHGVAGQLRARRDHDLGDAGAARHQRPRRASSAYCAASVRAWSLKSGAIERGVRGRAAGARRTARRSRSRPDDERHADERELEEAEAADAGVRRRRRRSR